MLTQGLLLQEEEDSVQKLEILGQIGELRIELVWPASTEERWATYVVENN